MDSERPQSVIPKACINCRIRKIRCNRQFPCSSCEASGIQCQLTAPGRSHMRSVPRRPQAAPKPEESIDLSESLAQIQESLQQLLSIHERRAELSSNESSASKRSPTLGVEGSVADEAQPAIYEGASSFAIQALTATEDSQAFARDPAQLAAARDGLRLLRNIVGSNSPQSTSDSPTPNASNVGRKPLDMQLPPTDYVVELLKEFKSRPSLALTGYGFGGLPLLERLCQAAYFPTEALSAGALTVMHGLLFYLIGERTHLRHNSPEQMRDQEILRLCEENFERGIRSYELFANPSLDHARALFISATKSQDECDINRAWMTTCAAARQVLSLGFHRQAHYTNVSQEVGQSERLLFWAIYGLDKSFSLALGQTSTIQDHDVDVDMFESQLGPDLEPWERGTKTYAYLARIQGNIFDRLYSASALTKSSEERLQAVHDLSKSVERWRLSHDWTVSPECVYPDLHHLIYEKPSEVIYNSLLTTIHRSSTATGKAPGTISQSCYEAACRSVETHLEIFPSMRDAHLAGFDMVQSYLTWNLIYWGFTPLIVVFLHAISLHDRRDLDLLVRFKETLEEVEHPKEGTVRLLKAVDIFTTVAQAYVGSKASLPSTAVKQEYSVVRHEDVQHAFEAPQNMTADAVTDPDPNWALEGMQLDGMYNLVDNWIDGSHVPMDYFSMDPSTWSQP